MSRSRSFTLALALIGAFAGSSSALPVWTESVDGELSGSRLAPTPIAVAMGSNEISGTTAGGDLDYFTIVVPDGAALTEIDLTGYDQPFDMAFLAIQSGTTITEDPNAATVGNLLGWVHLSARLLGSDVLDDLGRGDSAIGFAPSLGAGTYSFWLQQLNNPTHYTFDFVTVPEPTAAVLLALGLVGLAGWRHRARD